jgi:hypothetical protein
LHLTACRVVLANKSRFYFAFGGATIPVDIVPIITFLADGHAIPTFRSAGPDLALGFDLAARATAVEGNQVSIVAALCTFCLAIATGRFATGAWASGTFMAHLQFTPSRTSVPVLQIAIVTELRLRHNLISTFGHPATRLSCQHARETGLHTTTRIDAAIAADRITVVAGFISG